LPRFAALERCISKERLHDERETRQFFATSMTAIRERIQQEAER
jgi:hypothetical protein